MSRSFVIGAFTESSLLLAALAGGWLLRQPPLATLQWSLFSFLIGCAAALPPLGFFAYTLSPRAATFAPHRRLLDNLLRPLMAGWSALELFAISLLAGIGEEALFRGLLQGILEDHLGHVPGLAIASILFGLAHPISRTYAVIATGMGFYLGLLWNISGGLLAPVTAHALYDFLALLYFLRAKHPASKVSCDEDSDKGH